MAEANRFVQEEKSKWFKEDIPEEEQSFFQKRWMPLFKENSNQLIPPSNSYVLMNLLEAVVNDTEGTARRARVLKRPLGGRKQEQQMVTMTPGLLAPPLLFPQQCGQALIQKKV